MDESLVAYRLLVPLAFNDGTEVPRPTLDQLLDDLFVAFGGYTVFGTVQGAYRMEGGAKQVDHLLNIGVAIKDGEESELRAIVRTYCTILGQESVYLERTGGEVAFIRPSQAE